MTTGVRAEPRATPIVMMLSNTPKTRVSTSSRTSRTGRVKRGTSMMALATPMTAMRANATAVTGTAPMTAIGAPHSTRAIRSQTPRCRLPTRRDTPSAPMRPPTPTAAVSAATPASPRSRRSKAMTTVNTLSEPRT